MARSKVMNNTRLYVVLGILAFAIIIGTIIGSGYRERFTNNKIIAYFYMNGCTHCKNFEPIWDEITNTKIEGITFVKYNLDDKYDETTTYSSKYNITSAPTIMNLNTNKIYEGERTASKVIEWAKK